MKNRSPAFNYYFSNLHYQEFAEHKKTGTVAFEDGVSYAIEEIDIMQKHNFDKQQKKDLHVLKQLFDGKLEEK